MELNTVKVHDVRGSCIVYLPKVWVRGMGIKKGDKVTWLVDEGDHNTLKLKKAD